MLLTYASCRRDFWSDTTAYPLASVRWDGPLPFPGSRVLILIHGYRTDKESIQSAYTEIANRMAAHYDHVIGFVWPGGWARIGFWPSRIRAERSADALYGLLKFLTRLRCTVDIQTHSLGALVALRTPLTTVRNLLLTAPAVDDTELENAPGCRVLVYHSRLDPVLKYWYRLSRFGLHGALGLKGPRDPERVPQNVQMIDCSASVGEHGGYRKSDAFYAHWQRQLTSADERAFVELA